LVDATVTITGHGVETAPCRDVSQATTHPLEFMTAAESIHSSSTGSKVSVGEGTTELYGSAVPPSQGSSTIYLEYGPTTAYGTASRPVACTATHCRTSVTIPPNPTVLKPNAIYHFRAVVQNHFSGRLDTSDDTFKAPDVCRLQPKEKANFTGCELGNVDWAKRTAEFIVLTGTKMQRANLSGATLNGARMEGIDLTGADLQRATLWGVQAHDAILNGAKMQNSYWNSGEVDLSGAQLIDAKLNPANLQGVNLRGANLTGADLAGAIVSAVDFRDATLTGANFSGARLDDAKLPPSIAEAKCSNTTTWPDGTRGHGTECPPPTS
jgi:uncharacterized protein YjbI with pentapeptide repeats